MDPRTGVTVARRSADEGQIGEPVAPCQVLLLGVGTKHFAPIIGSQSIRHHALGQEGWAARVAAMAKRRPPPDGPPRPGQGVASS